MKKLLQNNFLLFIILELVLCNTSYAQSNAAAAIVNPGVDYKGKVVDYYSNDGNQFSIENTNSVITYNLNNNGHTTGFESFVVDGATIYDQKPYFVINTTSGGYKWTNTSQSQIYNGSYITAGYYRDYKFRPFQFAGYSDAQAQAQYHMYPDKIFEENSVSYHGANFADIKESFMEYPIDFKSYQIYEGASLTPVNKTEIAMGAIVIERPNGTLLAFSFSNSDLNQKVQFEISGSTMKLKHFANVANYFQRDHADKVQIIHWGRRLYGAASFGAGKADILEEIRIELNPLSSADFTIEKVSSETQFYSQNVSQIVYDKIQGIYEFTSDGLPWGSAIHDMHNFYPAAKISIRPSDTRQIYMRHKTSTPDGAGVLQDENGFVLPINLGITRSLGGGAIPDWTGSYKNIDPFNLEVMGVAWGQSEFPVRLTKNVNITFRSLHLVHRWGLRQFAATGSVLSETPISTSNVGVWCSVDLKPLTHNCGDIRSFSSTVTQWSWGHPCCEGIKGEEAQFAHAMEFEFPTLDLHELIAKDYKVPQPNLSHFTLDTKYSTVSDKLQVNYTVNSYPDNTQNRLLMYVEFIAKQDFNVTGDERFTLLRFRSNPIIYYNAFWKSNTDGSMSPSFISVPADVNQASSTIQTTILDGANPACALSDKRWSFDIGNSTPTGMSGVEANVYMQVFDKSVTIGGQKQNNIPIALKVWKHQPDGVYNQPDGSVTPNGNYVYYDLVLEKSNLNIKAGDTLKFAYLFMPYGGKTSNDEINSAQQTLQNFTYPKITNVAAGTSAVKKKNNWIPTVKSGDGSVAEFTVSGGDKLLTIAIEGLSSYKNPKIYKLVNGASQEIVYSVNGKDGGTLYIDENGSVGFSLPVEMTPNQTTTFKIVQDNLDGYGKITRCATAQTPYKTNAIPGSIEFEDFDNGCSDVAYHDNDAPNNGGQYRTTDGVDIQTCSEGGFNLGWVNSGEWLKYSVNVAKTATYNLALRIASAGTTNKFHLEVDGVDKTGVITAPDYGNLNTWSTFVVTVDLTSGAHVLRFVIDNAGGALNLNKMSFTERRNYWHFTGGLEEWNTPVRATTALASSKIDITTTAADPQIYSPDNLNLKTSEYKYVVFQLRNQTTDNTAEFFWTTAADPTFNAAKKKTFTIVPNDAGQRYYILDMSATATWTGTLKQLRFDPAATATTGLTRLDMVKLTSPYPTSAHAIPGDIEIENFNFGGQGNGFSDVDAANNGGQYRLSDGVDLQTCTEGGYNSGWTQTGEWMDYLVNVSAAGSYNINLRASTAGAGNQYHIEVGEVDLSGVKSFPNTNGFQTYSNDATTVNLEKGLQMLRLHIDNAAGGFNINKISVSTAITTSIQNPEGEELKMTAYPNPAHETLTIAFTNSVVNTKIELRNVLGELMYSEFVSGNQVTIPVSNLSQGVYIATLQNKNLTIMINK
ncbi:MAG: carbohydrate-binding protein [Bacteroidetes bacterium]|nr:carbohydrate-binding protein [Bacteroidota bacterium]